MQLSLRRSHSIRRHIGLVAAAGLVWGSFLGFASAQDAGTTAAAEAKPAKQMTQGVKLDGTTPIDLTQAMANPKWLNIMRPLVIPVLQVGKASGQQELDNVDIFTIWRIAELTWPAKDAKETPEQRRMLMKSRELLRISGTGSAAPDIHDRINALMIVNLPRLIADPEYSLVARYNAMLLLGQLDRQESDITKPVNAEPLAASQPILIQASQSSQLPEVLRIAALVGLARHAELQIPTTNSNRTAIAAEAYKILSATEPPAGISLNGFHWMRKLAMQIVMGLSTRGSEVNQPQYVTALEKILSNDKLPLFLRRDAALTIGHLDTNTIANGVKPDVIVKDMTNLAFAVTKAGGPRDNPDAPIDLTKPEDVMQAPTDETRRPFADAVSYYMNCIATGLGGRNDGRNDGRGFLKAASPETKAMAQSLLNDHINQIVNVMSKSTVKPDEMISTLTAQHGKIESFAAKNKIQLAPAPAMAAPAGGATPGGATPGGATPGGATPGGAAGAGNLFAAPIGK